MADAAERSGADGHAGVIGGSGRLGVARLLLWALAAVLTGRQAVAVLSEPSGEWLGGFGLSGPAAAAPGSLYDAAQFTGTPFGGLVLRPFLGLAAPSLEVAWACVTLLLVTAVGLVAARALPDPVPRRTAWLAAPVLVALMMVSLPVREAGSPGQAAVLPVLLVLLAVFRVPAERPAGFLVGLAAALQPALLLFAPMLWLSGRRTTARAAAVTFAGATALSWASLPRDSWTYWVERLAGTGLGAAPDDLANQSVHGALLRLGLGGPAEIGLYLVLAAAVAWIGLRRAAGYARDGQLLLAVAVTGCVAVAVSPAGWRHQLLWVLLAVAGKVGRRAADRPVWPVAVVLAVTLPSAVLLPNLAALAPVRDNVLLLAALAAACAVPFLPRSSPYWREPVPTRYGRPAAARWARVPLLPFWRRVLSRPNLLLELLLIRVGYSLYSHIRAAAPTSRSLAEGNGSLILGIERALGIDIEHAVNHAVVDTAWLEGFFNFYYTSFHFVVPLTILAVLYWRRPADYRWARASLGLATVLALAGFWLFPLAPPRLMPGLGFVDTVHGVQDLANPSYGAMTAISNQYAAMPSLHFGWSLWCGVVIVTLAPKGWQKLLGALHPTVTVCAIVATANHWVLDAVGGAGVVAAGFGLVHVLSGPRRLRAGLPLPRGAGASSVRVPQASGRT
ncbi:phosphatase PAP2 family protein [Streptomyces sp. NBC_00249]|uniref:bifunctional glycosyltransferase 87/phosphatase PAP2 family protein n=1 Tax=Streptomyces sp. NBC_00249 TaxID=2975690 RepID=UPI0022576415|nr:bifunctional glycosyltransferase 87/phosphatase PAP2 family protein [Streptomyces sp. NBC_00249]MCX5197041.1 phosphatase PAP2 family protein [Streptomyces sp. NBC_00249]